MKSAGVFPIWLAWLSVCLCLYYLQTSTIAWGYLVIIKLPPVVRSTDWVYQIAAPITATDKDIDEVLFLCVFITILLRVEVNLHPCGWRQAHANRLCHGDQ